jgi:hypothetical protein
LLLLGPGACDRPPASASPTLPTSLSSDATNGPRSLDCDYLLSKTEVANLIHAKVEYELVSYGDGASCQYQTALGAGYVIVFTGPNAEAMWGNRPLGTLVPGGSLDVSVVNGAPVGHVAGRWLTISGAAFDALPLEARIDLVRLLIGRL